MGLFWDLIQQSQLSDQNSRTQSLEDRVRGLESELERHRQIVQTLLERLERHFGEDLDRDGRIGG